MRWPNIYRVVHTIKLIKLYVVTPWLLMHQVDKKSFHFYDVFWQSYPMPTLYKLYKTFFKSSQKTWYLKFEISYSPQLNWRSFAINKDKYSSLKFYFISIFDWIIPSQKLIFLKKYDTFQILDCINININNRDTRLLHKLLNTVKLIMPLRFFQKVNVCLNGGWSPLYGSARERVWTLILTNKI